AHQKQLSNKKPPATPAPVTNSQKTCGALGKCGSSRLYTSRSVGGPSPMSNQTLPDNGITRPCHRSPPIAKENISTPLSIQKHLCLADIFLKVLAASTIPTGRVNVPRYK